MSGWVGNTKSIQRQEGANQISLGTDTGYEIGKISWEGRTAVPQLLTPATETQYKHDMTMRVQQED